MANLQQTINWAQTQIQYSPITAGLGQEPAATVASMIRMTIMNPPMSWLWNRNDYSGLSTVKGTQNYTIALSAIPDFGFLEKATLTDTNGKIWEIPNIYNNDALTSASDQQRPNGLSVYQITPTSLVARFVGVPDAIYNVDMIYQKKPQAFGPFVITSVAAHSGANTAYTGTFDPLSFPVGATAIITGCTNAANNGSFVVVTCTTTVLTVANGAGVLESTTTAYANNFDWAPIPDWYSDIYNNLFLAEMLSVVDDNRAQVYRMRGIAAFMSKAQGLTSTQKNAFIQQVLARDTQMSNTIQNAQMGTQARGV